MLSTVSVGYTLQFLSTPPSHLQGHVSRATPHPRGAILLDREAAEDVPQNVRGKGFYSWYIIISKSKGGLLPILDLHHLNRYLKKQVLHGLHSLHRSLPGSRRLVLYPPLKGYLLPYLCSVATEDFSGL